MSAFRYIFKVLALCFIVAFPYKASATKEIPFYLTVDYGVDPSLHYGCIGPWSRLSDLIKPTPSRFPPPHPADPPVKFYTAEVTTFSPYGTWLCCSTSFRTFPELDPADICKNSVFFKLYKAHKQVNLTMGSPPDGKLTVNLPSATATITATATLGDNKKIFLRDRDRDTWRIQGTGGDNVIITLEEDKAAGHIGEEATLILRGGTNGKPTIETNTGALPMEIMATLPTSGEYELVVENHGIPEDVRFRGNYFLSIESDSGEIEEIRPSVNVEP